MFRSIVLSTVALATFCIVGCASRDADSTNTGDSEVVAEKSNAERLIGRYYDGTEEGRAEADFFSLRLQKDGAYEARCAGCAAEIGKWLVAEGQLQLAPTKGGKSGARSFAFVKNTAGDLRLTDTNGRTQTLHALGLGECLVGGSDDCSEKETCNAIENGGGVGECVAKPAGVPCGKTTCTGGKVCCSQLDSMCVNPGQVCPN